MNTRSLNHAYVGSRTLSQPERVTQTKLTGSHRPISRDLSLTVVLGAREPLLHAAQGLLTLVLHQLAAVAASRSSYPTAADAHDK